jgi:uncharacterized lipoprotein YehR (DUF1307 family)
MRKVTLAGFALGLVFAVSGCGDSHESLTKDAIKLTNEMADVLESIKDKDSAEKAKPKLEKLAEKFKDLKKRMDKIGKPDKAKEEALEKKYKSDAEAAGKRLVTALGKAAAVPGGADAIKSLGSLKDLK